MASAHHWSYPFPEQAYNPAVSANVSSYFVRPNKVVKPNSRNTSPRNMARRKTMTSASASSRTRSVVDHLRATAQWQQQSGMDRSRPLSWHPDSFETPSFATSPTGTEEDLSCWNFSTAQIHGLVTPVAYPSMGDGQIQETLTSLDEVSAQGTNMMYETQAYRQQINPYSLPTRSQQPALQFPNTLDKVMPVVNVQTAPSSPEIGVDGLWGGGLALESREEPEELVAMGLYDSPAEIQSSSLLFGGLSGTVRKGLKLEESFEPTEVEEDEDLEDDEEVEEQEHTLETLSSSSTPAYNSHSIANHLTYRHQPQPEPLATEYLSMLRQMNSIYYPPDYHNYGWI